MKKRILALLLAAAMTLSLEGCGKQEESKPVLEPVPIEAPEPQPEPEPEPYIPSGTNPLTGLPMEEELENNRPVAVMFNNLKAAQPQLGVSRADIIYEVPAEGGITRMLGIYQSLEEVGNLGSIRSTRAYYLELALGHDALLVHAGGSPEAYSDIPAWGVDNMDGVNGGSDAKIFWRDPDRRKTAGYEHSMMTSGENIQAYLDAGHFRTEHKEGYASSQAFAQDGTPAAGKAAASIKLAYTNYKTGRFDYDSATGLYEISQYGGRLHRRKHRRSSGGDQCAGAGNFHFRDSRRYRRTAAGTADRQRQRYFFLRRPGGTNPVEQGRPKQPLCLYPL